MGIKSEVVHRLTTPHATACHCRSTPHRVFLALVVFALSCAFLLGAETNKLQVGFLPFDNLSADPKLGFWGLAFPQKLASELRDTLPPRLHVYLSKVLTELTNNAWDGRRIAPELAAKIARDLNLQKLVSGSFKRDETGWEVAVRIAEPGAEAHGQELLFKEPSTHHLIVCMTEQLCGAFGVTLSEQELDVVRKHPVSNAAIDRVMALQQTVQEGGSKLELIAGLRGVLTSEPEYVLAQAGLVQALYEARSIDESRIEARKLMWLAPELCWGYVMLGYVCEDKQQREQVYRDALKVHPGCPAAARLLFPEWVSSQRWNDLRPVVEKAYQSRPDAAVTVGAMAAVVATDEDQRQRARKILRQLPSIEEDSDTDTHATVLMGATMSGALDCLARELLWMQRRSVTNEYTRELLAQMDASMWLRASIQTTNALPRLYTPQEVQAELVNSLTTDELKLVENPLTITDQVADLARTLTAGLTNPTAKATVLFGFVIEERLKTETNSMNKGPLPVCHQYASRLVSLARSIGLAAWLVHVDFATDELSGYHDRAAIRIRGGEIMQFDPTLATLGDPEDNCRFLDEVQAIAHHLLQDQDLAKVQVAQKLDPLNPWNRLKVISAFANQDRIEEAQELWSGLGPEFTNRWDYYFDRAQIEYQRSHYTAAVEWLQQAGARSTNNPYIHQVLGLAYAHLHEPAKSAEHLDKAVALGAASRNPSERAELKLHAQLRRAEASARNMTEGQLRARVSAGDLPARIFLANQWFQQGRVEEAMNLLHEGAQQGDPALEENYGRNLFVLKGERGAAEAVLWLRRAAQKSHSPAACHLLATILYQGSGIAKDEIEASQWVYVGVTQGDTDCRSLLEEMKLFVDAAALAEGKKRAEQLLAR